MSIDQNKSNGNPVFELPNAFKVYENQPVWLCLINKKPVSPISGKSIAFNKPKNWGTFQQACEFIKQHPKEVIYPAIVISEMTGDLLCLDLDHVISSEGNISVWAQEVLQKFEAYTERSLGGDGFHVFAKGKRPGLKTVKNFANEEKLEIFDCQSSPKPIRLSFNIIDEKDQILNCQTEINDLYHECFQGAKVGGNPLKLQSPKMSDEEIIGKLHHAKNCNKFRSLFENGDTSAYGGDNSAADQALVNLIAFYTQDSDQIDRIFRESKLVRDK